VTEKARHYGIATALPEVTDPAEGLVLQYDLKLADGLTCGGAYMKFLTADADVKFEELKDDSAYTVMFGPDKCGATNKVGIAIDAGFQRWGHACRSSVSKALGKVLPHAT